MPKTATVLKHANSLKNTFPVSSLLLLLLLWPSYWATAQTPTPRHCLVQEYDAWLKARNPNYAKGRALLNKLLLEAQSSGRIKAMQNEETIIIPVVVHIVHNNSSGQIGGPSNPNISDAQIRSQIEVLNEDYQRKENTPGFNTDPVGANVNLEFRLTTRDPNGFPTTGITRHYSEKSSYAAFELNKLADIVSWPTNQFLNIWVTNITGDFIGYAQFPDMTGLDGLGATNGSEKTDGVLIDYRNFGRNIGTTTQGIYTEGRTTTHEIGHWLGLLHTWGDVECDTENCQCGTDYIDDTPQAAGPNNTLGCPEVYSNCSGVATRNMIENYMDYSPDRCMNIFTEDQKNRMRLVLELSPRRKELVEAARKALPEVQNLFVNVYPNPPKPGAKTIFVEVLVKGSQNVQVAVYNTAGQLVRELYVPSTPSTVLALDIATLNTGLYLVRVSTPTGTQVKRVLLTN